MSNHSHQSLTLNKGGRVMVHFRTIFRTGSMNSLLWVICCLAIVWTLCVPGVALAGGTTTTKDGCGYPDNSNPPKSQVVFNESEVMRAFGPPSGGSTVVNGGATIKLFYNDEHALTL